MRFSYDPKSAVGVSTDGRYTISSRGDRYGIFLDIGFGGEPVQTVWVRENQRGILPIDGPPSHGEEKVLEWVVDNNAAAGADRLLTRLAMRHSANYYSHFSKHSRRGASTP